MICLCLFVAVGFLGGSVRGGLLRVIQGESVNFALPAACGTAEERVTLIRRLSHERTRLVATFSPERGWKPELDYGDRMDQRAVLSPANVNDNGFYEFSCSSEIIQLDVVVATEKHVSVNGTVTLPCYVVTADSSLLEVGWMLDGEELLKCSLGSTKCEKVNEGKRVSVSSDWHRSGNMSLTMEQAQLGHYFCYREDRNKHRRTSAAWTLRVRTDALDAPTPSPPSQQQPQCYSWTTIQTVVVVTVVVIIVVIAPLCTVLGWILNSWRCKSFRPCGRGGPTQDEEQRLKGAGDGDDGQNEESESRL